MPHLTRLPCELIGLVLRSLNNVSDLLPSILTCRQLYFAFKANLRIPGEVLQGQIGPTLTPYAVAVVEAARLHRKDENAVQNLIKSLYNPESLELMGRLRTVSLGLAVKMARTHAVILRFANQYATVA